MVPAGQGGRDGRHSDRQGSDSGARRVPEQNLGLFRDLRHQPQLRLESNRNLHLEQ